MRPAHLVDPRAPHTTDNEILTLHAPELTNPTMTRHKNHCSAQYEPLKLARPAPRGWLCLQNGGAKSLLRTNSTQHVRDSARKNAALNISSTHHRSDLCSPEKTKKFGLWPSLSERSERSSGSAQNPVFRILLTRSFLLFLDFSSLLQRLSLRSYIRSYSAPSNV